MVGSHSRLAALTALTLGAGGLLTACGTAAISTSGLNAQQKAVAQTVSNFQSDAQGHNESKLCENDLARTVVNRLDTAGHTCTGVLSKQLNEVDDFSLTLASGHPISITGDTATAQVKGTLSGKTRIQTLSLVKEGNRWKISGLG